MDNLSNMGVIKEILKRHGFNFSKALGQNFLINPTVCPKMAEASITHDNTGVIEIGPGIGVLTNELAKKAKNVVALEIDKRLIPVLNETLAEHNNVEIINADVLKINLNQLIEEKFKGMKVVVCANLPYYITSPIIMKLLEGKLNIESITVMVQKEVGDRFCARVGTKEYGSFTVFLNYNFDVKKNFVVSRNCFFPRPNVDSVIVSLMSKDKLFVSDKELFYKLVYDSFKFKRKTLRNNLKGYDLDVVSKVLEKHGFDLSVRAEQISVDIFCEISNELSI